MRRSKTPCVRRRLPFVSLKKQDFFVNVKILFVCFARMLASHIQTLLHENQLPSTITHYLLPFYIYITSRDVTQFVGADALCLLRDGGYVYTMDYKITRCDAKGDVTHQSETEAWNVCNLVELCNGNIVLYVCHGVDYFKVFDCKLNFIASINVSQLSGSVILGKLMYSYGNSILVEMANNKIISFESVTKKDDALNWDVKQVISELSDIFAFYVHNNECIVLLKAKCKVYIDFKLVYEIQFSPLRWRVKFLGGRLYRSEPGAGLDVLIYGQFVPFVKPGSWLRSSNMICLPDGHLLVTVTQDSKKYLCLFDPLTFKTRRLQELNSLARRRVRVSQVGTILFY